MPHIVVSPEEAKIKKNFKKMVLEDPASVLVHDPQFRQERTVDVSTMIKDGSFTVTNHPKRSWVARVFMKGGVLKVE